MKAGASPKLSLVHSRGNPLLPSADSLRLARAFRSLAMQAERGELVGAATALWTSEGKARLLVAGMFETDTHAAYYATSKLADVLLYPEDGGLP